MQIAWQKGELLDAKAVVQGWVEVLAIKLEGKREGVQCIQFLVPLRVLPFNLNVCGLRHCREVGYNYKEFPFEKRISLDAWDITSLNN